MDLPSSNQTWQLEIPELWLEVYSWENHRRIYIYILQDGAP